MMPAKRVLALGWMGLISTAALLGCERPGTEAHAQGTATIDTINGVVHVANHGGGQWTSETAWQAREIFRFGAEREPVSQLFMSHLLGVSVGPHWEIAVLDHYAGSITVFSRDGQKIRTIGQRGRGPSDLLAPTGFTWTPDGNIWVSDPGNLKYAVFDSTGRLIRTQRRSIPAFPRRQYPMVFSDGLGIVDEASVDGDLVLLRTTADGDVHDTLLVVERPGGPSRALMDAAIRRPGPEFTQVGRHYVSRLKWAVDPSGGIWTGAPEELRFVKRDWSGDTLTVVTADHRVSRLTPADERLIATAMDQSGLERSEINPIRPLFQALHVIDGGFLLVQLVDAPGVASPRFDVYDPVGRYLGELELGFAPEPQGSLGSRGSILAGPMLGELDVPYVVGVELSRPER